MVLRAVEDIAGRGRELLHGVDARFHVLDADASLRIGDAVEIVRGVFNLRNPKGRARQVFAGVGVVFHDLNHGLFRVGEDKFRRGVGDQLNDAGAVVDEVALRHRHLGHGIRAGGQLREVDFAVHIGGKFLGPPCAVHRRDAELDIGNDLAQILGIHLDEVQPRLLVVIEQQLLHAVAGFQLDLLRCGVGDVRVRPLDFLHHIGAGFRVVQHDLAHLIGGVTPDADAVLPNLKGHVGHGFVRNAVIFHNAKAGLFGIDEGDLRGLPGHDSRGLGGFRVRHIARDALNLAHLIAARFELRELRHTARGSLGGLRLAGFQILDLDGRAVQVVAGIAQLVDAQTAIGGVGKRNLRSRAVNNRNILCAHIRKQVMFCRSCLSHGIIARDGHGNGDRAVAACGERSDRAAVRVFHFKHRARKRSVCSGFQFTDSDCRSPCAGRRVRGRRRAGIGADGARGDGDIRIGIQNIPLRVAIGIGFETLGMIQLILHHNRSQVELHCPVLPLYAAFGIYDLYLPGKSVISLRRVLAVEA